MAGECIHGIEGAWCSICNDTQPKPKRGRPPLKPMWAEIVKSWMPAVGDDWITGDDLAEVTGLSLEQVRDAVAYLRDEEPDFPLVSGVEGYRFSCDEEDINRYRASSVRAACERWWPKYRDEWDWV